MMILSYRKADNFFCTYFQPYRSLRSAQASPYNPEKCPHILKIKGT